MMYLFKRKLNLLFFIFLFLNYNYTFSCVFDCCNSCVLSSVKKFLNCFKSEQIEKIFYVPKNAIESISKCNFKKLKDNSNEINYFLINLSNGFFTYNCKQIQYLYQYIKTNKNSNIIYKSENTNSLDVSLLFEHNKQIYHKSSCSASFIVFRNDYSYSNIELSINDNTVYLDNIDSCILKITKYLESNDKLPEYNSKIKITQKDPVVQNIFFYFDSSDHLMQLLNAINYILKIIKRRYFLVLKRDENSYHKSFHVLDLSKFDKNKIDLRYSEKEVCKKIFENLEVNIEIFTSFNLVSTVEVIFESVISSRISASTISLNKSFKISL